MTPETATMGAGNDTLKAAVFLPVFKYMHTFGAKAAYVSSLQMLFCRFFGWTIGPRMVKNRKATTNNNKKKKKRRTRKGHRDETRRTTGRRYPRRKGREWSKGNKKKSDKNATSTDGNKAIMDASSITGEKKKKKMIMMATTKTKKKRKKKREDDIQMNICLDGDVANPFLPARLSRMSMMVPLDILWRVQKSIRIIVIISHKICMYGAKNDALPLVIILQPFRQPRRQK